MADVKPVFETISDGKLYSDPRSQVSPPLSQRRRPSMQSLWRGWRGWRRMRRGIGGCGTKRTQQTATYTLPATAHLYLFEPLL